MRTPRSRAFSLLEVLLAVAIVGGGIISLLVIRSNAIQMAGEAIRLRQTRLLAADQAGHALAMGLQTTLPARDPGEDFEGFRIERTVEEVAFDELLPEELLAIPMSRDAEPGGSGPGGPRSGSGAEGASGSGDAKGAGLLIRRLVVRIYPPGAEENHDLATTIATYQLDEPDEGPASKAGGAAKQSNFPEQDPPLVGPGAKGPPGSPPPDGSGEGSGSGSGSGSGG